jgi:hypothetical protein
MTKEYPWYDLINGKDALLQGDFIKECPVVIPPSKISQKTSDKVEVRIMIYNVIVMSQSCDLVQKKLDLVLVCPVWPLSKLEKESEFFKSKDGKEKLRQGTVLGYHLLNKCKIDRLKMDYSVVDFRSIYSVPFDFLVDFAKIKFERLRLLSPYREHLSQAFARFFMRVGLPVDIPPFN